MCCAFVRHRVTRAVKHPIFIPFRFLIIGLALITGLFGKVSTAAPLIRITGPENGVVGKELLLRAEAINESAQDILATGGFFEWWIGGVSRATTVVFRCRSSEPADYLVELHLRQLVGSRPVTLAVDRRRISFLSAEPTAQRAPSEIQPDLTKPVTGGSLRWVQVAQRVGIETNRVTGAFQRLEAFSNEIYAISSRPDAGTIEARLRWPAMPSTLTPGHQLIFDLQQELRLTPSAEADPSMPLSATIHARFFALSEFKHERTVESLSDTVVGQTNRTTRTKRIQWVIPSGRQGDRLSLEMGSQSPAGTASRFYDYRLEAIAAEKSLEPVGIPEITLVVERTNVPVGAATRVKAIPRRMGPQVQYVWTLDGLVRPETGDTITVAVTRPGPLRVVAEATDARNRSARAELFLEGTAPGVRLYKDAPIGYSVFIGEPISLRAEMVGMSPIPPPQLSFRWLGTEALFYDAAETATASNRARCYAAGAATARVELVYRPAPTIAEVIAQSDPIVFTVSPPSVSLVFEPPDPLVGQEVTLSVRTEPPVGGIECRWTELPTNAEILARSADCRELKFVLRDTRPAQFGTAIALPRLGLTIAEGVGRITASRYIVNIAGPSAVAPRPQVWHEGSGAVALSNEWAVGETLRFTVALQPSNPVSRWVWASPQTACKLEDDSPISVKAICAETGRYELIARALDSRGIELGAARKVFAISIAPEEIAATKRRNEAQAWREKGYAALQTGNVAEALSAYRKSYSLQPSAELLRHIEQLERQRSREAEAEEQAAALRREEEKKHAEAARLKEAAWEHIRARRYDEGLEAFRRSLALKPDSELEAQVQQIREAVEKRRARQAEAARLRRQAEGHEAAGRLKDALQSYRASLAAWQEESVEQRVALLEKKIAAQEASLAEANALIADGERLEQEGDWDGALAAYRQALERRPEPSLSVRIARLEERKRQQAAEREMAKQLRDEAQSLLQAGRPDDALLKLRESLRLVPDDAVASEARAIEEQLRGERETRETAIRLRDEAAALALAGRLEEALLKYQESVALLPNADLDKRIRDLEAELKRRKAEGEKADRLLAEAKRLEAEQKWEQALAAYRELLAIRPDADAAARVATIEAQQRQRETQKKNAAKLASDAEKLASNGALEDALLKYRESLRQWPNDAVAGRAREIENKLAEEKAKREKAIALRDEAATLVLAGQWEAALAKYEESVSLQASADVEKRIETLQAQIAKQRAAKEKAQQLIAEGARLEAAGRWEEALSIYRKAMAFAPNTNIQTRLDAVEARRKAENERRLEAASLREKAAAAVAAKQFEKALQWYRQSLDLEPNATTQQQIAAIEKQMEAQKSAAAKAEQFYQAGLALEQDGHWEEAAAKFKSALTLADHKKARQHLITAQREAARVAREKEKAAEAAKVKEATARKLREEGLALQQKGQLSEAAARFRASLDLVPDPDLGQLLQEVERAVAEQSEREARAQALANQAREDVVAGRLDDAIRKYEDSLKFCFSADVEDALARAKKEREKKWADIQRATTLRQQAATLEKEGKFAEAAELLRESLIYHSDADTRVHAARLTARVREQAVAQKAQEVAEAKRKESAQRLWEEADVYEKQGRLEDALLKLRAGLEIWPDDIAQKRAEAIETELTVQKNRVEKARLLEQEAAALEKAGRWEESLAKYRGSLAICSNAVVEQHIAALEQKVQDQRRAREEAARLDEKGRQALAAGLMDDAVAAFEQSLSLLQNPEVEARLAKAKKQREEIKRRQIEFESALETAKKAQSEGHLKKALEHARAALALQPDNEQARQLTQKLQTAWEEQETAQREAQAKAREAQALEEKGNWEAALAAYHSSLNRYNDPEVRVRFEKLQQRVTDREKRKSEAARLRDAANMLVQQNKLDAALAKYKESLALWPDKQLERQVTQLEAQVKRDEEDRALAQQLRNEAEHLEREGRKQEALIKYQESLHLVPDATIQTLVTQLQTELERERITRETADKLWSEGMIRFRSGKTDEGLVLLRQSLQMQPNPQRSEALRQMEGWAIAKKPDLTSRQTARSINRERTSVTSQPVAASAAPTMSSKPPAPTTPVKKDADMAGSRWKGVILFRQGDAWLQWPLIVRVSERYDVSASYEERDAATGQTMMYVVSGVWDPNKKVWYMACLRSDGQVTHKATLTGQLQNEESAGGTVSVLLGGTAGREPIKGIWRLLRQS